MDNKNFTRFLLTFFLGFIGSFIINNTGLKPQGYRSRTLAYFFISILTFGIYALVASISNFSFDPSKPSNIGYIKE
jgi:glycerol uptake facilitator-like aquaporin